MMDLLEQVLEQEHRVWGALRAGDGAADAALLAPGFLGLYPSGYAGRDDHAGQLAAGPTVATYQISAARVMDLGPDLALLTYHARYTRPKGGPAEQMWVSSLWQRQAQEGVGAGEGGAGWINLFSQDTPCDTPFDPV